MSSCEIVISGFGWVTPFAWGPIQRVMEELSSLRAQSRLDPGYSAVPDQIGDDCTLPGNEIKKDRGALIAAIALSYALESAEWSAEHYAEDRVGLVLGHALAGQLGMIQFANEVRKQTARFVSPIHFPQTVGNFISGALARAWSIRGPNSTVACGNASGLGAIADGCTLIETGQADAVFAGGTDLLIPEIADSLAQGDGAVSDGASVVVLERSDRLKERGGTAIATVGERNTLSHSQLETSLKSAGGGKALGGGLVAGTKMFGGRNILIDRWIGQCLGAWGTACLAAGICAARGCVVPTVSGDGTMDTPALGGEEASGKTEDQGIQVLAFADGDDGAFRTVNVIVHPTA